MICKLGFIYHLSDSKVTTSDSNNLYNQTSNSRAAVFDIQQRQARERLAKQDARARIRSSSGAFARECAEQLIESRELCTAAWRCGCRAGTARLLFFCRRFLFQIKRKCRNAGSVYHLIVVRRKDRVQIPQFHIVPLSRQRCVEVDAPYKLHDNKIVRSSRADDIRQYHALLRFSLLLITLSEAK